jgi:hypothetical protein
VVNLWISWETLWRCRRQGVYFSGEGYHDDDSAWSVRQRVDCCKAWSGLQAPATAQQNRRWLPDRFCKGYQRQT